MNVFRRCVRENSNLYIISTKLHQNLAENNLNKAFVSVHGTQTHGRLTYLDSFHGTHNQHSLHDPSSEPTQQAPGAVQTTRRILRVVTEELKHAEPKEKNTAGIELWERTITGVT